jgi:serine protein kinase
MVGEIISEWWARSNRNGGRDHSGMVGDIERNQQIEDQDFKDPDTGQLLNRELLNQELTKIEKPAGIANPKDFRNEVVKFSLRSRAQNGGKNPSQTSHEKIREVIEKRIFSQVEDLLPVISFGSK